jgi:tellurite methyltransferase
VPEADRERWNTKYEARRAENTPLSAPSAFLVSLDDALPRRGRALDLGGGSGRNALWLAERGVDVTLADVSDVGLAIAQSAATERGVSIETVRVDLEDASPPPGPWDLIVMTYFLWRPLFALVPDLLSPGGLFAFCQPTQTNLERNAHPRARFLLKEGELPALVSRLETIRYTEGWTDAGSHEARLLARRRRK